MGYGITVTENNSQVYYQAFEELELKSLIAYLNDLDKRPTELGRGFATLKPLPMPKLEPIKPKRKYTKRKPKALKLNEEMEYKTR